MMIGRLHPTARAELLIGAAAFLIGAAVGALVEAFDALADARRAEREQLRNAGRLVDALEDERDQLASSVDALERQNAALMAEPMQLPIEVVREALAAHRLGAVVRESIAEVDGGERVRDAIAAARAGKLPDWPEGETPPCDAPCTAGLSACDGLGDGCPHVEPDAGYPDERERGHAPPACELDVVAPATHAARIAAERAAIPEPPACRMHVAGACPPDCSGRRPIGERAT